jgi:hypothetical protein
MWSRAKDRDESQYCHPRSSGSGSPCPICLACPTCVGFAPGNARSMSGRRNSFFPARPPAQKALNNLEAFTRLVSEHSCKSSIVFNSSNDGEAPTIFRQSRQPEIQFPCLSWKRWKVELGSGVDDIATPVNALLRARSHLFSRRRSQTSDSKIPSEQGQYHHSPGRTRTDELIALGQQGNQLHSGLTDRKQSAVKGKLLKEMARRTGRFPQLVGPRSRVNLVSS